MRWFAAPLMLMCAALFVGSAGGATDRPDAKPGEDLPGVVIPIRFTVAGPNEIAIAAQQQGGGYYRPVPQQQPYQRACGTVATDVCPVPVALPPGATGAQVYDMGKTAEANHRKGEAMWLLEKSAELGYMPAEGALGMDYLRGIGTPLNSEKGIHLLDLAAKQGSAKAEMYLGICFEEGSNNVRADEPRAIAYFRAAAVQHESLAEYRLGLDYEIGRGVPHNRTTAVEYLHRAAADGQSMAGTTANFLARSRAPQYHSVDEIDAAMAPPAPKLTVRQRNSSCQEAFMPSTMTYSQYCTQHPLCPYLLNNVQFTCPAAPF